MPIYKRNQHNFCLTWKQESWSKKNIRKNVSIFIALHRRAKYFRRKSAKKALISLVS